MASRRRRTAVAAAAALLGVGVALPATPVGAQEAERHPLDVTGDGVLTYVALGDSFTAGPLVVPQVGDPLDCARSGRNYPHLAAASLDAALVDVSCSSATIDDFAAPQSGLPLGGTNPPQFDALGPEVDVVTVGIGGNDVGFVSLAFDCLRFPPDTQPCTPDYVQDGRDEISERIAATAPELAAALRRIRELAPTAEVLVVGYPTSLPDDAVACYPLVPILPEDMPYLRDKFVEMNAMLATTAAAEGATYVDIYTSSIGHDACQPPLVAWVNGFVLVPPSFPAHPNELSFVNSAPIVAAAITDALAAQVPPPAPAPPVPPVTAPPTVPPTAPPAGPVATAPAPGTRELARTGPGVAAAPVAAALALGALALRRRTATA